MPRRRGRLTSRARNAMAKTIARVPRRTRPMTRMLSSISAREAAVLVLTHFFVCPGRQNPAPARRLLTAPWDQPCYGFAHRRRVGPALPGDVERRAVPDRGEE